MVHRVIEVLKVGSAEAGLLDRDVALTVMALSSCRVPECGGKVDIREYGAQNIIMSVMSRSSLYHMISIIIQIKKQ